MEAVFNKKAIAMAIVLASITTVVPVQAQDAVDEEELLMLDEVVVTARKREESLQDSPVAISAFSAETLREAGVSTMRDLSSAVPGLNFSEQGSKATSIFIRGVGQRESNSALDPGVGVYINGIFIARTDSQLLDTLDTESVQVLRGPQGTLFGKNTTGGAMLVTTKSPNTEAFSGSVGAKLGNYGRRDAKVFLNIPLNDDNLSMRAALNSVKRDGYMENVVDGRDFGDEDRLAATARVLWEATDNFAADLFLYASKQNENGAAFTCRFENVNGNIVQQLYPLDGQLRGFQDACLESEALAEDNKIALNESAFRMQSQIAAITLSWDLDDYEIKSITGYGHQDNIVIEDDQDGTRLEALQNGSITRDFYYAAGGVGADDEKRTNFSQEFNIIGSAFDESLSYTIGLFYSQESMSDTPFVQAVGAGTFNAVNLLLPGTYVSTHKFLGTTSDLDTETAALFAQTTYDVTDWFQLTLGARYTSEKRERDLTVTQVNWAELASYTPGAQYTEDTPFADVVEGIVYPSEAALLDAYSRYLAGEFAIPLMDAALGPDDVRKDDKTWSKFTPAITLSFNNLENYVEWDDLDTAMVYFTFSKGFKAGGFEPKGTTLVPFDPEEVANYELGAKVDAYNRTLRVNAALYYMDYTDMQVRVAERGRRFSDLFLYLSNAGEATIKGYELEVTYLPVDNLMVMATFNYTKGEYKEFDYLRFFGDDGLPLSVPQNFDRSGEPFGGAPEKSGSLTVSYNIETESAGLFIPRLTAAYRDELYVGLDYQSPNYDPSYLDSFTILNARLTWMPDDRWNITAFVDNLTDKEYFQGGFALADLLGAATVVKAPPRMYGVEAYYEF